MVKQNIGSRFTILISLYINTSICKDVHLNSLPFLHSPAFSSQTNPAGQSEIEPQTEIEV